MKDKEYYRLTAREIISLVKAGKASASDIISSHFKRIALLEDKVKAWAFLDKEQALKNARRIDEEISSGKFKGALYGLPVGIKDVFNTFDMPTSMGSPQWEGFASGNDARVVDYIRKNGAVFPGKTVTAEFAVHHPGKTVNPNNYLYSPGTSSSGSAASVACFMVPVSIGTQTGGSIIRPASYCGIFGFKPSFGLIPRTGVLKTVDTLDTIGCFARAPGDLEIMFDVMRVHGHNFPIITEKLDNPGRQKKINRKWKIVVIPETTKSFSQPYSLEAVNAFIEQLNKNKNFKIIEDKLPREFSLAHDIHSTVYEKSLSYYFQREFSNTKFISQIIYDMISRGKKIKSDKYNKALEYQNKLHKIFDNFMSNYDAIITLSTQGIAPLFGQEDIPDTCLIWTLCGAPVISMPVFKGPDDMPFGLQVVARRYNDILLLDLVKEINELGIKIDVNEKKKIKDSDRN